MLSKWKTDLMPSSPSSLRSRAPAHWRAATTEGRAPTWALGSSWVYRAEVGSCVIGLLYLTLVALLLAWRGETFRRIQGPAGAGVETPARIISSAAEWFVQYEAENA